MRLISSIAVFLTSTSVFLPTHELKAQALGNGGPMATHARSLDDLIRFYAYRSLVRPRTGVMYSAKLPSNITGIRASVVRLRSGSLLRRGLRHFHEFDLPPGLYQTPYVLRVALIYQNLGNWSSIYHSLPGYRLLTPVLGLLAYDATDLDSTHQQEVEIVAPKRPILITFRNVGKIPDGIGAKCVQFYANGSYRLDDSTNGTQCEVFSLGHYSIVVNSTGGGGSVTPPQSQLPISPKVEGIGGKGFKFGKKWRLVAVVVGGLVGLMVVVMLMLWIRETRRREEMGEMVKRSDGGEVLKSQKVGGVHLPVASMVRTRPVLENEYVP